MASNGLPLAFSGSEPSRGQPRALGTVPAISSWFSEFRARMSVLARFTFPDALPLGADYIQRSGNSARGSEFFLTKNLIELPTSFQSSLDCVNVEAALGSPLGHCERASLPSNKMIVSFVVRLLRDRNPSTVFRRIRSHIVDAIYLMLRTRWLAHVRVERGERLPSLTNRNAASAISWVIRLIGILASPFHVLPNAMNARAAFAVIYAASNHDGSMLYSKGVMSNAL